MKIVIFSFLAIYSIFSLAQGKRILPMPPPDLTCVSNDQSWSLLVNVNLGAIRVVDNGQDMLSHKLTDLRNDSKNGIVRLYNYRGNNDLPEGIVFQANLEEAGVNAFGIDDQSGRKTAYSCARNQNIRSN